MFDPLTFPSDSAPDSPIYESTSPRDEPVSPPPAPPPAPSDPLEAAVKDLHCTMRRPLQLAALRIAHEKEGVSGMVRDVSRHFGPAPFFLVYHARTRKCYAASVNVRDGLARLRTLRWGFLRKQRAWKLRSEQTWSARGVRQLVESAVADMLVQRRTEVRVIVRAASGTITKWCGVFCNLWYGPPEYRYRELAARVSDALELPN